MKKALECYLLVTNFLTRIGAKRQELAKFKRSPDGARNKPKQSMTKEEKQRLVGDDTHFNSTLF